MNFLSKLKTIPGVNVFFHLGSYTWFVLLLMLGLFRGKKSVYILGFCPTLINILTCIASPNNGDFRYYLPSMIMAPLLLAWAFYGAYLEPQKEVVYETDHTDPLL